MITFVHQPEYIPWIGFFDKLLQSDIFIVYDDAQFVHGGFQNRNRIRTMQGWRWLTVPIKHNYPQLIKDVKIAGDQWKQNHLRILRQNYDKAPYFKEYFSIVEETLAVNYDSLIDLDLNLIEKFAQSLGFRMKLAFSSKFPHHDKEKNGKLISLCKHVGADTYLSGSGGKKYMEESKFSDSNIKIIWHNYTHPFYKQNFDGFEPNMSIIDLLFNLGPEAKSIILKGSSVNETVSLTKQVIENTLVADH